jgi:hypothetical protein
MAKAFDALRSARAYLNDINGVTWSDSILMPLLQEAHGELQQELELNNTSNLKIQSNRILVPALTTDLGGNLPSNIINPISILEGDVGVDIEFFEELEKVTFIPAVDPDTWLRFWAWIGENIVFLGATADREIIIRYEGGISTPTKLNDSLGVIFAERYIGPRVAALAYSTAGKDNQYLLDLANAALYKILKNITNNDQRPVRRRGYRSPKGFMGPFGKVSVPVGSITTVGGGSSVNWILTSTPPDGVRTSFDFNTKPKYISWNGLNQFETTGYTVTFSAGKWHVVFHDVNNVTLTPDTGDDIREAV